jgi:hypothetical protein
METNYSNYQLFPSTETMTIDTIIYNLNNNVSSTSTSNYIGGDLKEYFKITKEEIETIQTKKNMNILSIIIDREFKQNPTKMYNLTKHTLLVIDEIEAEIYISIEMNENGLPSYFYKIISKNVYYELEDDDMMSISDEKNKDFVIYDNYGFDSIISLLNNVQYVRNHYKMLDYCLLSPESMEEAIAQREFIPISQDKICTVCYEPTVEYTTCKHSLCFKCREKCIVQGKKTCPICRNSDLCIYHL